MTTATATKHTAHVQADDLRHALKLAGAAVKRGTTPREILKYVLLDLRDMVSRVQASDGDIGVNAALAGVDCDAPFKVCVRHDTLSGVLSGVSDMVTLELEGSTLSVKAGHGSYKIPCWPDVTEFPPVTDGSDREGGMEIPLDALQTAIGRTVFAIDVDSSRYALSGVAFDGDRGELTLASTDARRLSIVPVVADEVDVLDPLPVVPSSALGAVLKMTGETVVLSFSVNDAVFVGDDATVVARLVEGRFPRYQQVIPQSFLNEVEIVAGPFVSALRSASMFTDADSKACEFCFEGGDLFLRSSSTDKGAADVSIPVAFDGEFTISLQPSFLIDFASKLDPSEPFTFGFNDAEGPVLLTAGEWRYIVMPLTKDQ